MPTARNSGPIRWDLFGKEYWEPVHQFIKNQMFEKHHTISEADMNIYVITDSVDEVVASIKKASVSEWWNIFD